MTTKATYHRLPEEVITNELYAAKQKLNDLFERLANGNDYKPQVMAELIAALQTIDAKAEEHKVVA